MTEFDEPLLPLRVLTIWQPWAEMIARGWKTVENRTWKTAYRGRVCIHAGTHWTNRYVSETLEALEGNGDPRHGISRATNGNEGRPMTDFRERLTRIVSSPEERTLQTAKDNCVAIALLLMHGHITAAIEVARETASILDRLEAKAEREARVEGSQMSVRKRLSAKDRSERIAKIEASKEPKKPAPKRTKKLERKKR